MLHEVKFIQGLPLSFQEIPDKEVWFSLLHGEYTTRTAYKLMEKAQRNNLPSCSSNVANNKLWKGLWSLQVPYKVKHFLWRATNESLPTLHNLLRRNVVKNSLCPHYKATSEDAIHVLWSCKRLVVVWEFDYELYKSFRFKFLCFADQMELVLGKSQQVDVNLFTMVFWYI